MTLYEIKKIDELQYFINLFFRSILFSNPDVLLDWAIEESGLLANVSDLTSELLYSDSIDIDSTDFDWARRDIVILE